MSEKDENDSENQEQEKKKNLPDDISGLKPEGQFVVTSELITSLIEGVADIATYYIDETEKTKRLQSNNWKEVELERSRIEKHV